MDEREVELQRARREGFLRGAEWREVRGHSYDMRVVRDAARLHFPMQNPRVVTAPDGTKYRVRGEWLEYQPQRVADWMVWGEASPAREHFTAITDLLANPYEDVPE